MLCSFQKSPIARIKKYKQVKAHFHSLSHHSLFTLIPILYSLYQFNTSKMLYSTFIALGLATAAAAITVTAPSNSTGWTSTGAQVIEWDVSFFFSAFLSSIPHIPLPHWSSKRGRNAVI
jgi:hypothetical protein